MTVFLAIDTASSRVALALAGEGRILRACEQEAGADHSRQLLPMIDALLAGDRPALAGVAVVTGPGSYAGLRVGVATAQGLALARALPLRGLPTLDAVAAAVGPGDYTAIHPAGRGEYAALAFRDSRPVGSLRALKRDELADHQTVGEGAGAFGGREVAPAERCRAALLALLPAFAAPGSDELEPLYLHEPPITLPRRAARPA